MLVPSQAFLILRRSLKDKSNFHIDVKFCRAVGICPNKLLCARHNCSRPRILPMASGIEPDNSFIERLSIVRPLFRCCGMLPLNKLLSNLSSCSTVHSPILSGISPDSWFLERISVLRFTKLPTSKGRGPDSELCDKSK